MQLRREPVEAVEQRVELTIAEVLPLKRAEEPEQVAEPEPAAAVEPQAAAAVEPQAASAVEPEPAAEQVAEETETA